jgi:hypothetical protein
MKHGCLVVEGNFAKMCIKIDIDTKENVNCFFK